MNLKKRTGCKDETNSDLDRSFTRSSTEPYNKENCFFCQDKGTRKFKLHKVTTFNAGSQLRESVEHSSNQTLLVRLNTVIDSNDAHAIDVLYHKVCWNTNVINPSRPKATKRKLVTDEENNDNAIEVHVIMKGENVFVDQIKTLLKSGQVINMASVEELYENVMSSLGIINSSTYTRRKAKYLLQEKISDLEFSIPMQFNQPELLSMKRTKDIALSEVENNKESDLRSVVNAAKILRKKCLNVEPWLFNGTLERTEEHIPYELLLFFRGIVKGTVTDENQLVNKKVYSLAESTLYSYLSQRQVTTVHRSIQPFNRHTREWPLQLATGILIHETIRSKKLIDYLHSLSLSVDYKRILRLENQMANEIIARMHINDGIYIPSGFVKGRHVFLLLIIVISTKTHQTVNEHSMVLSWLSINKNLKLMLRKY